MRTLTSSFNGGECCDLTLGLTTKVRAYKMRTKNETRESHFVLLGLQEGVRE